VSAPICVGILPEIAFEDKDNDTRPVRVPMDVGSVPVINLVVKLMPVTVLVTHVTPVHGVVQTLDIGALKVHRQPVTVVRVPKFVAAAISHIAIS
jgi:hypothetical protein